MTAEVGTRANLVEALEQKRAVLLKEMETVDAEVAAIQRQLTAEVDQLRDRRQRIENYLQHIDALLGLETPDESTVGSSSSRHVGEARRASPADAVCELLVEMGTPVHYKELCRRLMERGVPIPGKNPAANLLAYMSRDGRFKRTTKRGVYALKEWKVKAGKSRRRTKRRRHATRVSASAP